MSSVKNKMLDLRPFCLPLVTFLETKLRQTQNLGQNHREEGGGACSQLGPHRPLSPWPWPCVEEANQWQVLGLCSRVAASKEQAA